MGSDPIIVAWHQDGFSGACVAPGGPEEGGGGGGAGGPLCGLGYVIPYPRVVYYRCGSALTDGWIL